MSDLYGTVETNPINEDVRAWQNAAEERVQWNDPRLARVTRLRLLSDPGFPFWDLSYCYGKLKTGEPCEVILPFDQLPKGQVKDAILAYAKKDRVYAKGLGILDNISTLC